MKKWTENEKRVLLTIIQHHPNNLTQAFRLATLQLNRTEYAMSAQWYKHLRKGDTQFILMSSQVSASNSKNSLCRQQKKPLRIWDKLKHIFTK